MPKGKAPPARERPTPVAEMANLTQRIRREEAVCAGRMEYRFNPRSVCCVTEKLPAAAPRDRAADALDAELAQQLERFYAPPAERQPYPLTTAQEIGWDDPSGLNGSRGAHNVPRAAETRFADAYIATQHVSVYSKLKR